MPIENLALSPQCGFASVLQGNVIEWTTSVASWICWSTPPEKSGGRDSHESEEGRRRSPEHSKGAPASLVGDHRGHAGFARKIAELTCDPLGDDQWLAVSACSLASMATLFITGGVQSVGKTTLAKQLEIERFALRLTADEWLHDFYPQLSGDKLDKLRAPIQRQQWRVAA